jgi:non-canonical poly(A) RNA polymerase PAPD5/7
MSLRCTSSNLRLLPYYILPSRLHREVKAFVEYISPTPVEDEIRELVVQMISKTVTDAFPDAQVHPFGSFATKLYLPLGDIDLVILSESMAYSDKVVVLRALANALKRSQITNRVTIIAKAKVPIAKFITHQATRKAIIEHLSRVIASRKK